MVLQTDYLCDCSFLTNLVSLGDLYLWTVAFLFLVFKVVYKQTIFVTVAF